MDGDGDLRQTHEWIDTVGPATAAGFWFPCADAGAVPRKRKPAHSSCDVGGTGARGGDPDDDKARIPYTRTWNGFVDQAAHHQLTVLHDEGLYRHLRMAVPGMSMWHWEVVTWAGHLPITGAEIRRDKGFQRQLPST